MMKNKILILLLVLFVQIPEISAQSVNFHKSHKIDSIDWLFLKDFQIINGGAVLFGDFESKLSSSTYADKYQFGAFRINLDGDLHSYKLISDITHNFFSSFISFGSEYVCLTNQPYQYFLTEGYSKYKIGSFRMDNLLNIYSINRYPDATYLPAMFFSPSLDKGRFFYGDSGKILGYYSGYKTNILHETIADPATGQVQENIVFDLNTVKNKIVKDYIPDRFLDDVFWMETGAIEHNGEIFMAGYFVSFKSDAEYTALPLNLICKVNKDRTELTYKILDYSATAFNFFKKDEYGNFYSFRSSNEVLKFDSDLNIIFQKALESDNTIFYIHNVYFYNNSLYWSGSTQMLGGMRPLVIKSDLSGNRIWEVVLDGNTNWGNSPVILQKTPVLFLVYSGMGNNIYISEIEDFTVGVSEADVIDFSMSYFSADEKLIIETGIAESYFEVYSIFGERVLNGNCSNSVDVSGLRTGLYFLKIGNSGLKKFIKY